MWYVKKTGINYVDNINLDNLQPIYHSLLLKKKRFIKIHLVLFLFYAYALQASLSVTETIFNNFYTFFFAFNVFGYLYDFDIFISFKPPTVYESKVYGTSTSKRVRPVTFGSSQVDVSPPFFQNKHRVILIIKRPKRSSSMISFSNHPDQTKYVAPVTSLISS